MFRFVQGRRDPHTPHWILLKLWPPLCTHPTSRNRRSTHRAHFPPPHGIQPRRPAGEGEAELEKSKEKPSKYTTEGARAVGVRRAGGKAPGGSRRISHAPQPAGACRLWSLPCALPRPRRPGLSRRRGPGHVWRTRRRSPGVTYIRDRRPGPPEAPAGPRQRPCRPMRLGSGQYPLVRGGKKKGKNEGRRAGGGRRCRHLCRLLLSAPLPPAQPRPHSRYVAVPVAAASPSHSGDNDTTRPDPARPSPARRAPTSVAHPPRGGRDGMGVEGANSREIRSEPPREFSNARDTAPGAGGGGLRTTDPGVPRGGCFRSRPGVCRLPRGTPGAVVRGPAGPAPGRARSWPPGRAWWGRLCSPAPPRGAAGTERDGPSSLCPSSSNPGLSGLH